MASHSATPGKHMAPARQAASKRSPKTGGGSRKTLVIVALIAVIAAFASGAFLLRSKAPAKTATPEAFIEQMDRAAEGAVFERNVFGGALITERKGGQTVITADSVPPNICVSVGWKLVRKGVLSINGTTPLRVSAAKLSELCNQEDGAATLTWSPKTPD